MAPAPVAAAVAAVADRSRPGPAAAGCPVCADPWAGGPGPCYCCRTVASRLGLPPVPVTAVVVAPRRGVVARRLRAYKDAPVAERREEAASALVDLVERWVGAGGTVPAGTLVTVPSTTRPGPPPVDRLVAALPSFSRRWCPGALVSGPGRTDHLVAARDGFRPAVGAVDRMRRGPGGGPVVVVDDAYTTGARAQSAAAALRRAGLRVGGIVVIGRLCGPAVRARHRYAPDLGV